MEPKDAHLVPECQAGSTSHEGFDVPNKKHGDDSEELSIQPDFTSQAPVSNQRSSIPFHFHRFSSSGNEGQRGWFQDPSKKTTRKEVNERREHLQSPSISLLLGLNRASIGGGIVNSGKNSGNGMKR